MAINLSAASHLKDSTLKLWLASFRERNKGVIMECGGSAAGGGDGFHSYRRQQPKSTSALNMLLTTNKPSSANNTLISNHQNSNGRNVAANSPTTGPAPASIAATNNEQSQQCVVREQDQYMPIANVIRIMRRILPSHAKISDDAKETIQECVSEYISFITGEANERCQREQRKTVTAEDVLWAMGKLGFDDYIEPLTVFLNRYRESESDRIRTEPMMRRNVDYGPQVGMIPPYGQAFQIGHVPAGMFDAMGGYYSGGGNGGSSSGNGSQL